MALQQFNLPEAITPICIVQVFTDFYGNALTLSVYAT